MNVWQRIAISATIGAALWGWPHSPRATVVRYRSLDMLIREASTIVRGRVLSKRVFWGARRRHIYTAVQIAVLERLKGVAPKTIEVRKLGGTIGHISTHVPGTASYRLGSEVVLFLEPRRPGGYYFVLGLASGKFEVVRRQGESWLVRTLNGLAFHLPPRRHLSSPIFTPIFSEVPITLRLLRQRIALWRHTAFRPLRRPSDLRGRYLRLLGTLSRRSSPPSSLPLVRAPGFISLPPSSGRPSVPNSPSSLRRGLGFLLPHPKRSPARAASKSLRSPARNQRRSK